MTDLSAPYQQGLLLPDLPPPRPRRRRVPQPAAHRAIHVSGYDRSGRDFYATPDWVTEALLRHVRFRAPVWEPCCGDGAMARVLAAQGGTKHGGSAPKLRATPRRNQAQQLTRPTSRFSLPSPRRPTLRA